MKETRFFKIVIVVLLLINLGTLAFLWIGRRPGHNMPNPPGGRESAADFLIRELQLTPEQQQQYGILRREHHSRVEGIQDHSKDFRHSLFNLMKQPAADSIQVIALCDSIARGQQETELITFNHFRQVRNLCTPAQQRAFDDVIEDALKMMAPRPPGPRPPDR